MQRSPANGERLVADYLRRLEASAKALPDSSRIELVDEIAGHIHEALDPLDSRSDHEVRTVLARLGAPEEVAEAAEVAPRPPPARAADKHRHLSQTLLSSCTIAGGLFGGAYFGVLWYAFARGSAEGGVSDLLWIPAVVAGLLGGMASMLGGLSAGSAATAIAKRTRHLGGSATTLSASLVGVPPSGGSRGPDPGTVMATV